MRICEVGAEYIVDNLKRTGCNMKAGRTWIISILILVILIVLGMQIQGCEFKIIPQEQERREVEFIIVSEECIPKEIQTLIETRKEEEIKLTYVDDDNRYIIIGYGKQSTGGYSIYIKDLYATDNALYVDTCLLGPKKGSNKKEAPSYPVIVLQIAEMGLPVVFK